MNENDNQGADKVLPPPNSKRALNLLREVRELQQQFPESSSEKKDTVAKAQLPTTRIAETHISYTAEADSSEQGDPRFAFEVDQHADFPKTLARFKIEKLVGKGGFARVFLAYDPKLDRKVALKVPNLAAIASAEFRERFDREARAAGILSHPSIVPVFESGNVGPLSFIAYEYCEGETLADWFERQRRDLSPKQAAGIVEQLAYAVEHAHQRGIIHRDLKPANILVEVSSDGQIAKLRITDFGLAKNNQQTDSFRTTEGAIVGTPAYMSPEQASGDANVNAASDVFSLGVVFYELLTGQLPFKGINHIKTLHSVANDSPSAPARIRSGLPIDLEAICLKSLAKDPAKRYASAFELAEDLKRWSQGFSVSARRPTVLERTAAWCKRNPGITLALLGMTIGFGVAIYQWNIALNQSGIASRAAEKAERNIKLAQQTIKSMVTDICTSSSIEQKFGRKLLVKAIDLQKKLIEESANEPDVIFDTAFMYNQYAVELLNANELENALSAVEQGISLLDGLNLARDSMTQIQQDVFIALWLHKARVLATMKRHDEAHAALSMVNDSIDDYPPLRQADIARNKAIAHVEKEEWNEAWLEIQNAMVLYQSCEPDNDFQKLIVTGSLAGVHFWCGKIENELERYREAERTLIEGRRLIKLVMEVSSEHVSMQSESTRLQRELGRAQLRLGKYEIARKNLSEAASSYDALSKRYPKTPRYGPFAFDLRLESLGLELETGNFLDARSLVLRLGDDFETTPFQSFEQKGKLRCLIELAEANLQLMDEFNKTKKLELADEHKSAVIKWVEYIESEFPESDKAEMLIEKLAAMDVAD